MPVSGKTPLWEALQKHVSLNQYPLHVPGHKQGRGLPSEFSETLIRYDLTELPGLDNLLSPHGVLLEAEHLARDAAGSLACYFTTNGSSAGLIAALLATCSPGDTVLLPRNAHLACLHACVLGDIRPVFARVSIDPRLNVALGVDFADLSYLLQKHSSIKAVLVVNPTYQGICGDIKAISNICSQNNISLLVDEAHGTHFLLGSPLPPSGLHTTAAIVIQSVHKTGLGMTGAAWIQVKRPDLVDKVKQALRLVQSTSPSYALLASLDISRSILVEEGHRLLQQALNTAHEERDMFVAYQPPRPWLMDPLKIVVDARAYGTTGYQLEEHLRQGGVAVEAADETTITLVLSLADGQEAVVASRKARQYIQVKTNQPEYQIRLSAGALPPLGEQLLTPREAHYASTTWCAVERAGGLVAGDPIIPYPPGIPLVWPGQRIQPEAIEYLLRATALGASITGLQQGQVRVLK